MNINKVWLMGRRTADPELKMSANNIPVLRFTVAVNRKPKKDSKDSTADFIDCTAFYKSAEFVSKYFKKGDVIIVFGSLQIDQYKDKEGKNQRSAKVIVDEVQFGSSKSGNAPSVKQDNPKQSDAMDNALNSDFFADVKDIEDDLPF